MENFVQDRSHPYQYNYRAEQLIKLPPPNGSSEINAGADTRLSPALEESLTRGYFKRTAELPSSFQLLDAPQWNNRTGSGQSEDEDRQIRDYKLRVLAKQNSQRKLSELTRSGNYLSPVKRVKQLQEEIRHQKRQGTFSLDRRILQNPVETEEEAFPTKNRFAVETPTLLTTTRHSGVWELSKTEGRWMWSDTGSFVYDSPGDIVHVRNLDKKNYGALTLSATSLNAPRRINLLERERKMNSTR